MNIQKLKAYFGFSQKSGSIILGVDLIVKYNKPINLIVCSTALSEKDKLRIQKTNINFLNLEPDVIQNITGSKNIKAFALLDVELANAFKNNI